MTGQMFTTLKKIVVIHCEKLICPRIILIGCILITNLSIFGQKVSKASGNLNSLSTWTDLVAGSGTINISFDNIIGTFTGDTGTFKVGDVLFNDSDKFVGMVSATAFPDFTLHNPAMASIPGTPFKKQGIANTTLAPTGSRNEILVIKREHTVTIGAGNPFTTAGTIINNGTIATDDILTFNGATYIYYPNGIASDDINSIKLAKRSQPTKIIQTDTIRPVFIAEVTTVDVSPEDQNGETNTDKNTALIPMNNHFAKTSKVNAENVSTYADSSKTAQNALIAISSKLQNESKTSTNEHKSVVFKVQILASREPATEKELKQKYSGNLKITIFNEDQWYKYSIGEFSSYAEAKQCSTSTNAGDAFIIAYVNNVKVHVAIAKGYSKVTDSEKTITENLIEK